MTTCSRCGNVIPGGQPSCQYCGMPVVNRNEYAGGSGKGASEQGELPVWLQSLRAGTQPTYSNGGPNNYSGNNQVDDGSLPGWMRSEQGDTGNMPSSQQPALRPSSMPAPNTDGVILASGNMSASSLIDEQSLPSWMQESSKAQQQGIAASSLLQPEALPPWLRNAGPQFPTSPSSLLPSASGTQPQTPPTMMSIPNSWSGPGTAQPMQPSQPSQPVPPVSQPLTQQPVQQVQQAQPAFPPQGFSAQELIDPQSLPPWLSGQQAGATGGASVSAASLLDMNALPPWLRESGQGQAGQPGAMMPPPSNVPGQGPMPGMMQSPQPPQMQPPVQQTSSGNLAAASFIDMDALPAWLRAPDGQPGNMGQGGPGMPGAAGYARQGGPGMPGVPPRAENVRVPSRPRGAAGAHEESEVAANVFASMLGVASNAPYLPGQQSPSQVPQQPQGMGVPGTPGIPGSQQSYPAPGGPGYGPQSYPGQQSGMPGQMGQPGGYPMGNQPGYQQMPPGSMSQGWPNQQEQQGQNKPAAKKRGFLDTIRDWFTRS